jgi:RNA polymerase sigma factor (sigma-70 family)
MRPTTPSNPTPQTTQLRLWVDRLQRGDAAAREELLRGVCGHLERLVHGMLRRFPAVRRQVETDEVLQNALLRLLRSLENFQPASTAAFFQLAALNIRRELLTLAEYYARREFLAAVSLSGGDVPVQDDAQQDLERWARFHAEVGNLPEEERDVVGLLVYHDQTREQAAEVLGVHERTVRRRWRSALVKLRHILGDDPVHE